MRVSFDRILLRVPFAEAIAPLLEDKRFSHYSKSMTVNLHNIIKIDLEDMIFKDNQTIYFSKKICRDPRTEWADYWQGEEEKKTEKQVRS